MMDVRLGALLLLAGTVLFLVAAFSPVSRVFGLDSDDAKLDVIGSSVGAWRLTQVFFAVGAVLAAIAVGWIMMGADAEWPAWLRVLPGVLMLVGAILWSVHTFLRAADFDAFVNGALPGWHFATYTVLTIVGLALVGIAFLITGPRWLGLVLTIGPGLLLVTYLTAKDLPPFAHYLLTLVLAIHVLRSP